MVNKTKIQPLTEKSFIENLSYRKASHVNFLETAAGSVTTYCYKQLRNFPSRNFKLKS